MKKPVIGITAANGLAVRMYSQRITYPEAIDDLGGIPFLLPCLPSLDNVSELVSLLDGVLVPGGMDVEPSYYNQERQDYCGNSCVQDDAYDIAIIKEAIKQHKPILGICRGMQIVNACLGGTLYQDIPMEYGTKVYHSMWPTGKENYHMVTVDKDSYLASIIGTEVETNSSHHQAVKEVAPGFKIVARALDGTNEAMENEDHSIICVQWHPERMQDRQVMRDLVQDLIKRSEKNAD